VTVELEQKVAALCRPDTYPEAPRRIEVLETHMSFVFLTPTHAYKMKKPVHYDSLDFSTLERRRHFCHEELRLNVTLAAGVYLAVLPLTREVDGRLAVQGRGATVEWLIQMRRLPQSDMLDERIRRGTVTAPGIEALAGLLAEFYAQAAAEPVAPDEQRAWLLAELERDRTAFEPHAEALGPAAIAELHGAHLAFIRDSAALLDGRVLQHRFVDGHGDIRPEHVCLLPRPVVFDRVEFNRRLRIVDPVWELAHLGMECERLGAAWIGDQLLARYTERTSDSPTHEMVDFYKSRSASIRARLAVLHTRELAPARWQRWLDAGRSYLALARRYANLPVG
jgi:aminoglycoside phosphotransferase family enzyme